MQNLELNFDVIVCGGGLGGVCAAIASARKGVKTALIQNRPVLGGNASSEVRVHIGGATEHGYHFDARESGIIEEIRLETAVRDPYNEYFWIDTVLYTICHNEPMLELFLNTNVTEVKMDSNQIVSITGNQIGTEKIIEFKGKIFIDGTGDGTIGYLAGAEYRIGRESKREFNERFAPEIADKHTLGASIMFQARDLGRKVLYTPPNWAFKFTDDQLRYRKNYGKSSNFEEYWHSDSSGWWWVEYGGKNDSIHDNEEIRFHLQAIVYGLWDRIKNVDSHHIEKSNNFEITWISQIPGKRESRRLIGDYLLRESDLLTSHIFDDQIAIGGWSIDQHPPEGFYSEEPGSHHAYMNQPYTIPYRSIYSRNISNLLIASRCISATHVAHASTRLIATLACIGQAAGTAAALCVNKLCVPRDILNHSIQELQQELLKDDQYLMGITNQDTDDLARDALITSNSEHACDFGNPTKFIPLYFPLAQRFYFTEVKENTSPEIYVYLRNESRESVTITGGMRQENTNEEFIAEDDFLRFKGNVPSEYEGWVQMMYQTEDPPTFLSSNYWIYLDENDEICWGKNEAFHWNGMRTGYFNEEKSQWQTVRINGNPFFDKIIGFYGNFCFKILGVKSPYPASNLNNGKHRPFISPNCWMSEEFRENCLKDPQEIIKAPASLKNIEIAIQFNKEVTFSEIWITFDTELNNSYPHQSYGEERIKDWPIKGKAPKCIRDLDILVTTRDENNPQKIVARIRDNYQRKIKIKMENTLSTEKIILIPLKNWGFSCFSLYEVRIY